MIVVGWGGLALFLKVCYTYCNGGVGPDASASGPFYYLYKVLNKPLISAF